MRIVKPTFDELCWAVNNELLQGRQVLALLPEPDGFACIMSDDPANKPMIVDLPSPDSPYGRVNSWKENIAWQEKSNEIVEGYWWKT